MSPIVYLFLYFSYRIQKENKFYVIQNHLQNTDPPSFSTALMADCDALDGTIRIGVFRFSELCSRDSSMEHLSSDMNEVSTYIA